MPTHEEEILEAISKKLDGSMKAYGSEPALMEISGKLDALTEISKQISTQLGLSGGTPWLEVISGEMHLLRSMTTKPKSPDANDVPTVRTLLYNIQKLLEAKAKQDGTQFAPLISKETEI